MLALNESCTMPNHRIFEGRPVIDPQWCQVTADERTMCQASLSGFHCFVMVQEWLGSQWDPVIDGWELGFALSQTVKEVPVCTSGPRICCSFFSSLFCKLRSGDPIQKKSELYITLVSTVLGLSWCSRVWSLQCQAAGNFCSLENMSSH